MIFFSGKVVLYTVCPQNDFPDININSVDNKCCNTLVRSHRITTLDNPMHEYCIVL